MVPHTINTTAAYRQLHNKCVIIQQCYFYKKITGGYSQNIIIKAMANKYKQNHKQTILP